MFWNQQRNAGPDPDLAATGDEDSFLLGQPAHNGKSETTLLPVSGDGFRAIDRLNRLFRHPRAVVVDAQLDITVAVMNDVVAD